jgi:hypothetical protein
MKYNKMNQKLGIGVLITILAVSMLLVNSEAQAQITTAGTGATSYRSRR